MAWRIGCYEGALRRAEKAIGNIDGDALFALGFQTVEKQSEIDLVTMRTILATVACNGGKLVLEDEFGFI